jgi:hypothetical protein
MKKLPRKSASQPQHLTKTSTINSAEHEATLLRLQMCFSPSGVAGLIDQVAWPRHSDNYSDIPHARLPRSSRFFWEAWRLEVRSSRDGGILRKTGVALYAWRNGIEITNMTRTYTGASRIGGRTISLFASKQSDPSGSAATERSAAGFVCVSVSPGLGELYRATGRTAAAIIELEWVVRFFPKADPKTYLSLALANQTAGKHDAAVSARTGKREASLPG